MFKLNDVVRYKSLVGDEFESADWQRRARVTSVIVELPNPSTGRYAYSLREVDNGRFWYVVDSYLVYAND